jgi:histidinol-phosphatase (PHP family)
MNLRDQHLHSRFSVDSEADPRGNCLQAIDRGLSGITFTEHYDMHPDDRPKCIWDYSAISESVLALREEFAGRLEVGLGIEVCYQPLVMSEILDYLESHEFDLVLLSIHWCDNKPVHVKDNWTDCQEVTRLYMEAVLEALQFCLELKERGERPFDVLSHIDMVKRYSQRYWNTFDVRRHGDLMDEVLRTAIAADVPPEINTSTMRDGVGEPMPAQWTIERYAELGGKVMSIGSDSHQCEHIGDHFEDAVEILRQAGIEAEVAFSHRERYLIPLS